MNPKIKVYRGYANEHELIISGHVFNQLTPDDYSLGGQKISHAKSILGLFNLKTLGNHNISLHWRGKLITTRTMGDGFFSFNIPYTEKLESGWHACHLSTPSDTDEQRVTAEFIKPHPGEIGLISDIDDTFLISHSHQLLKKIYVLLTRNVQKRKIFEGVVEHYRLLSESGRKATGHSNVFFYVSSSEWNLYNLIDEFTQLHNFPKAILKLKRIKTGFADFLYSGTGDHDHKFHKIKHILEFYPTLKFVLLGDDSQQDPFIYERIAKMFPKSLFAIYIRQTRQQQKPAVLKSLANLQSLETPVCYFRKSSEAIAHSRAIGLI